MITRRTLLGSFAAVPLLPAPSLLNFRPWQNRLIDAARKQIGVTRTYDPSYQSLEYPLGDVARRGGVCTDVIIRAYRDAFSFDLQEHVHLDMTAAFSAYPKTWGLSRTDRNIDHRRVPNLETFFTRRGSKQTLRLEDADAGDLISMRLGGKLPHIAIISSKAPRGRGPMIIHNIGSGTREERFNVEATAIQIFRFVPP